MTFAPTHRRQPLGRVNDGVVLHARPAHRRRSGRSRRAAPRRTRRSTPPRARRRRSASRSARRTRRPRPAAPCPRSRRYPSALPNPLERALADEAHPLLGHEARPELAEPLDLDRPAPRTRYAVAGAGSLFSRRSRLLHRSHGSSPPSRAGAGLLARLARAARRGSARAAPRCRARRCPRRTSSSRPALARRAEPAQRLGQQRRHLVLEDRGLGRRPAELAQHAPRRSADGSPRRPRIRSARLRSSATDESTHASSSVVMREVDQRLTRRRRGTTSRSLSTEERDRVLALAIVLAFERHAVGARREVLEQRVQPTGVARLLLRDRRAGDRALERRRADAPAASRCARKYLLSATATTRFGERRRLRAVYRPARAGRSLVDLLAVADDPVHARCGGTRPARPTPPGRSRSTSSPSGAPLLGRAAPRTRSARTRALVAHAGFTTVAISAAPDDEHVRPLPLLVERPGEDDRVVDGRRVHAPDVADRNAPRPAGRTPPTTSARRRTHADPARLEHLQSSRRDVPPRPRSKTSRSRPRSTPSSLQQPLADVVLDQLDARASERAVRDVDAHGRSPRSRRRGRAPCRRG